MAENHGRLLIVTLLTAATVLFAPSALAEDKASAVSAELAAREKFIKSQFVQLKTKMLELADILEKTEPDSARILRQTVGQAQEAYIAENMDKVSELLARGLASVAVGAKADVVKDLRGILQTLRYGLIDIDKRLKRIEEWKKLLASIDEMLTKQKDMERDSYLADKKDAISTQMDSLAARMADIISEQKDLLKKTQTLSDVNPEAVKLTELRDKVRDLIANQDKISEAAARTPVAKLAIPAVAQDKLAVKTDGVKQDVAAASEDSQLSKAMTKVGADGETLAKVSRSLSQAAVEMRKANGLLLKSSVSGARNPQIQAKADLQAAEKALSDAIRKMAEATPAGKLSDKQSGLAARTDQLAKDIQSAAAQTGSESKAGDMSKATEHMNNASDKLAGQNAKAAAGSQEKALEELEKKAGELADLRRRVIEKTKKPLPAQTAEQKVLTERAKQSSEQMKSAKPSPTPGQPSMEKAAWAMDKAAGQLSKSQSGQANSSQQKAIEELEKVREELAEQLKREEEIAQAETLVKIDQMLEKMLNTQRTLTAGTARVYVNRTDKGYARPEQLALTGLSHGEGKLAEDSQIILDMLKKEGSTIVFPTVLGEVKNDLGQAQALLAEREAGAFTQDVQRGIEQNLQEMIDALRKELARRRKKGGGGGGGGGGGKSPLVPPVAELKMLRSLQLIINGRTALLDGQKIAGQMPAGKLATEHKRLAGRQDKVRAMVLDVAKKMQR